MSIINNPKLFAEYDAVSDSYGFVAGSPDIGSLTPSTILGSTVTQLATTSFDSIVWTVVLTGGGLAASMVDSIEFVDLKTEKSLVRYIEFVDFGAVLSNTTSSGDTQQLVVGESYLVLVNQDPFDGLMPCTPALIHSGNHNL